MAEQVANYYFTSEAKPSIFEVIAQRSLNVTIEPALRKLAEFLATYSPDKFSWLAKYYDETFMGLNGCLSYYYLNNYGALFSEYFYGMKRLGLDDYELTNCQKNLSWIHIVLGSYFKRKIDKIVEDYKYEEAENNLPKDHKGRLIKTLLYLHSASELVWRSWTLINFLRYMSNQTESQLPILNLLGLKLVYSNVTDDFQAFWMALFRGQLSLTEFSAGFFQNAVRGTLELSAFFVQFLQAWNTEKTNFSMATLPPVEPPSMDTKAKFYKDKCPVCLESFRIPTVLPVSGYVFCFACIFRQLKETGKCPVTGLPAKPLDVVRLFQ